MHQGSGFLRPKIVKKSRKNPEKNKIVKMTDPNFFPAPCALHNEETLKS